MTFGETADVMRKAADAIDRVILQVGKDAETGMSFPVVWQRYYGLQNTRSNGQSPPVKTGGL